LNPVKLKRLSLGITQREMALLLRVPLRTLQRWETARTVKPHIVALVDSIPS
jgi:DNA-binding transcriptional regulator YiaG